MHSCVLRSFIALLSVLAVTSVTRDASAQAQGFAARFTSSGAKDTAFNNNTGRVLLSSPGGTTFYAVAPSGNGGFLLAGEQDKKFVVERLNSNGTPDVFFGPNGNGVVTADFSGFSGVTECVAFSVTADPGGGVIAAGTVTKDGYFTVAVAWWDVFGNPAAFGNNGTSLIRVAQGSPKHGANPARWFGCV